MIANFFVCVSITFWKCLTLSKIKRRSDLAAYVS